MNRYKVSAVDQMRTPDRALILAGPVDVPSVDDIRSALVEIARIGPQTRIGLRADASRRRWLFDPEAVAETVVEVPSEKASDISNFATTVFNADLTRSSIKVVVSGDYVASLGSHGIADGIGGARLWTTLIRTAQTGMLPAGMQSEESRLPLMRSILRTYGSDPRRLVATAQWQSRLKRSEAEAVAISERGALTSDPVSLSIPMDQDGADRLAEWREAHAPSVSLRAISLYLFLSALRSQGVETASSALVLMDMRRYASGRTVVNGNFAVGQRIPISGLTSPHELSRRLSGVLGSGRPLITLGAITAKATVASAFGRSMSSSADFDVSVNPLAVVSYSDIGKVRDVEGIRWTGDPLCVTATDPYGPEGIVFLGAEIGGRRHLSVTFHGSVFNSETIRRVLRAVALEPMQFLE